MFKVIKNKADLNEYLHQLYLQGLNNTDDKTVKIEVETVTIRPQFSSDEVTERALNLDLSLRRSA